MERDKQFLKQDVNPPFKIKMHTKGGGGEGIVILTGPLQENKNFRNPLSTRARPFFEIESTIIWPKLSHKFASEVI